MKKKYSSRMMGEEKAQAVGEYIEIKWSGSVTPEELVQDAKKKESILHDLFEWNNEKAAKAHRLHQARQIINTLYIEVIDSEPMKAYESIIFDDERRYISTERISESVDISHQVIKRALSDLNYWKLKYNNYRLYFEPIFRNIEELSNVERKTNKNSPNKKRSSKTNDSRRLSTSGK